VPAQGGPRLLADDRHHRLVVELGVVEAVEQVGLYKPWEWSLEDTAIDVIDKLVQAEAAGAAFEALSPG